MNTAAAFADTVPARWGTFDTRTEPTSSWIDGTSSVLLRWLDAARSRQSLHELDEHLLRDIGLTRDEARREADKFFWQV